MPHPVRQDPPPLVSVIVVNYNAGALLAEGVGAALAATVPVEVIVSDNGSVDDSLALLIARYGGDPRLAILENGANLGFSAANNRALPLARGDWLLFLNPDCLMESDTLERLLEAAATRPAVGLLGCLVRNPDGSEQVACRRVIPDPWIGLRRALRLDRWLPGLPGRRLDLGDQPLPAGPTEVEAISGSFMLARRRALEEVGPLDEGYFLHCEDLDWFVRFRAAGWGILLVPEVSVMHLKGACSTGDPRAVERHKHRGMARFFRKHQAHRHSRPFVWLVLLGIRAHLGARMLALRLSRRGSGVGA